MGYWPRYAFALAIGIILSAVFVYTGGAATLARLFAGPASVGPKELTYVRKNQNPLVNTFRPDERLNGLVRALRKGDLQSLQLLRPEFLRAYGEEELRGKVIPTLRSVSLEALLSRMTDQDRDEWQQRSLNPISPSPARQFVDDVSVVNESLGVFLDTAAELFEQLHRSTKNGRPFLIASAGESESNNAQFLPTKLSEDQQRVISIPLFRDVFERERAREVRHYMTIRPTDVKGNLALLASVDPSYAYAEFYQALEGFLAVLAQRVTPSLRLAALNENATLSMLKPYQDQNPSVRAASARLYNLAALDAIGLGELNEAAQLLRVSEDIQPGFAEQTSAHELLDRAQDKKLQLAEAEKAKARAEQAAESEDALGLNLEDLSAEARADEGQAGEESGDSGWEVAPLFIILMAFGSIVAMVVAVLVWRKMRIRHLEALAAHRLNVQLNNQLSPQFGAYSEPAFKKKIENQ